MDVKKALELFNSSEKITNEELEKQYLLFVRISKSEQSIDMNKINQAYKVIKDHIYEENNLKTLSTNPLRQMFEHIFEYYRIHIVVMVFLIIFLLSMFYSIAENKREQSYLVNNPIDLRVMLFGEYFTEDLSTIENNIKSTFPQWPKINVGITYSPIDAQNYYDIAMQHKIYISLVSEIADIYILDQENFDRLVIQEAFLPLDTIETLLKRTINEERLFYVQTENDTTHRLYGVDLVGNIIFNDFELLTIKENKIAAVRFNGENLGNALQFIETLALTLTD